jgi:hypothetical protein
MRKVFYLTESALMQSIRPMIAIALIALCLALAPEPARAEDDAGFDRFCAQWMAKLAQRERNNLAKVRWEKHGPSLIGQYTGYARTPIRCQAGHVTAGRPAVGKLVYQEILYQKTGPTPAAAQGSSPAVLQTTEVMEVFRYDGSDWKY